MQGFLSTGPRPGPEFTSVPRQQKPFQIIRIEYIHIAIGKHPDHTDIVGEHAVLFTLVGALLPDGTRVREKGAGLVPCRHVTSLQHIPVGVFIIFIQAEGRNEHTGQSQPETTEGKQLFPGRPEPFQAACQQDGPPESIAHQGGIQPDHAAQHAQEYSRAPPPPGRAVLQTRQHTCKSRQKGGMAELQSGVKARHDQKPHQQQNQRIEIISARLAGMRRQHRENGRAAGQRGKRQKHRPDGHPAKDRRSFQQKPGQQGIDENDMGVRIRGIPPSVKHGRNHQIVIGLVRHAHKAPGQNQKQQVEPYGMEQRKKRYPSPNLFQHKQIP